MHYSINGYVGNINSRYSEPCSCCGAGVNTIYNGINFSFNDKEVQNEDEHWRTESVEIYPGMFLTMKLLK